MQSKQCHLNQKKKIDRKPKRNSHIKISRNENQKEKYFSREEKKPQELKLLENNLKGEAFL
jgi:hypothetical protein